MLWFILAARWGRAGEAGEAGEAGRRQKAAETSSSCSGHLRDPLERVGGSLDQTPRHIPVELRNDQTRQITFSSERRGGGGQHYRGGVEEETTF